MGQKETLSGSRNTNLDFIRVMSMVFVIGVHIVPKPASWSPAFVTAFQMLLLTCNSNFYMLSGELNLKKKVETPKDYRNYYVSKGISILFPYVAATCLLTLWNMVLYGGGVSFPAYFKNLYHDFFVNNEQTHLWFMYPLAGMLLSAPFLSRMLNRMEDFELHLMFAMGILWGIFSIYLTEDIGGGFSYRCWLWGNWSLTFFAGYYSSRVITKDNKKVWYCLGLGCLILNLLASWFFPQYNRYSTDLAPAYVVFVMAAYVFLKNEISIKGKWAQRILLFLAKHSFMVYMVHYHVIISVTHGIIKSEGTTVSYLSSVGVTLAVSLILAMALDVCVIHPVQKGLRKLCFRDAG